MPLALDYRPRNLKEFEGNAELKEALGTILDRDIKDIPHCFLLTGPSGCGKTTLGRIIAKRLGCADVEFKEINSASVRGIADAREMEKNARYAPMAGDVRVYLMDECHKITKDAQEALLKPFEDCPPHVYYICGTTDPQDLKDTFKRRLVQFEVKPLTKDEMLDFLDFVVTEEKADVPEKVLKQIYDQSKGSPAIALQILEKVIDLPADRMEAAAEQTAGIEAVAIDLARALLKKAPWKEVAAILKGMDAEPETVRRVVIGYCNTILLGGKADKQAAWILELFKDPFYNSGKPGLTLASYQAACVS